MLIDCHVHSLGNERVDEVIKAMDQAGIDRAIIFAPYPAVYGKRKISVEPTRHGEFSYPDVNDEAQRKSTEFISNLQAEEAPDRIIAFAWIEPRLKNAVQNVERRQLQSMNVRASR